MTRDLRTFFQLLYTHRWRYAVGALALVFSDGGHLLVAYITGQAIDAISTEAVDARGIGRYALAMIACGLVVLIARFIWRHMIFGSARRVERDLRQRLFDHLQTQDAHFYLTNKVGELMAYATNDVAAIQVAASGGMLAAFDAVIQFALAAAMMFLTVDPKLSLVALAPLVLLTPATYWLGRRLHTSYGQVQSTFAELSDRVQEDIAGVRVIKGFAREEYERDRFAVVNDNYYRTYARMLRFDAAFDPMIEILAGLSFTIGLVYGGTLVIAGELTLGNYVAFNTYLMMLVWPMLALGWVTNLLQRAAASGKRLEALFAIVPDVRDGADARPLQSPRGHIRLSGLTFHYAPDLPPALVDVDLDLAPGRTVGVLGRTGSGKSTVAQLLIRAFNPPDGTVFFDGEDVNRLRLADLRRAIAYVPQDSFLFSRSVADNIAFEPAPHDREAVVAAARLADIDADIAGFPAGYDTPVGERGITLSGGQRQRVGLARALVKEAPVLVLDDCLSAVDTATEARILEALRAHTMDRTTVIISHRVSAVRHTDEILVLAEGRVAERGTHADLVALGGEYAQVYRRQQLEAAIEGAEA